MEYAFFCVGREVDGEYPMYSGYPLDYNATTKKYEGEYTFSSLDVNFSQEIIPLRGMGHIAGKPFSEITFSS